MLKTDNEAADAQREFDMLLDAPSLTPEDQAKLIKLERDLSDWQRKKSDGKG